MMVTEGKKYVYAFAEGNGKMKSILGGKGAGLAEMTRIGLPVPPGFTISTEACNDYITLDGQLPQGLESQVEEYLKRLEDEIGKEFGDPNNPLLVSVRSGAAVSMPGMMDTILNLGLNDETVEGMVTLTGDKRFVYDSYRRFIQMFSDVVLGVVHHRFEEILDKYKRRQGVEYDNLISSENLVKVVKEYKELVLAVTGSAFPMDPKEQLLLAIRAVFNSWQNDRAIVYRRINKIPDDLGTAVNVQSMVFGNMGNDSGTGVVFTRNPSTGEKKLYGEYLLNAQGEDVVAGIRTPDDILEMGRELPIAYEQLVGLCNRLEEHYGDMQDIEFTVERNHLYILQTRNGKRTARASIKIAYDLVSEGKLSKGQALLRIDPNQTGHLLHRNIDPSASLEVVTKGLPASPGAASGIVVFCADKAEELGKDGQKVILVRTETTPDDIHGMVAAEGILTSRGGMTSHAAVVARGLGKPCVAGADGVKVDEVKGLCVLGNHTVNEGEVISIDGATGSVYLGPVPLIDPELSHEFQEILRWADLERSLGVLANADTPEDAQKARDFGAEGIGLCRTEHMFFAQDRLPVVQSMILSETKSERMEALQQLLPIQQGDFYEILKVMAGYPVTIRLLDPPLHEFLPNPTELSLEIQEVKFTGKNKEELHDLEELLRKVKNLEEANPMLGHRGCRLGITFPEIYEMQARAICQAAAKLEQEGVDVYPEIMIPLVGHYKELEIMRELVVQTAEEVEKETGVKLNYKVGTMIEVPRAALTADEVAVHADFFSFGTNDLTQTTFGFSRDDAEAKFIHEYVHRKILPENPFVELDQEGVGQLLEIAVRKGRSVKPELKVGICGEHGGDPSSIDFCHRTNLNYVSCSSFRVPVARLAAAQAKLRNG